MKTFVMLCVICLVLIMDLSSAPVESEERSSEKWGNSEESESEENNSDEDSSDEVKITNEKKLFRKLPQTAASFLSYSFMYKCQK